MEKSTPIFTPQILKHVTQDKSYSWRNKQGQIRRIVSYKSSMNYLTASHVTMKEIGFARSISPNCDKQPNKCQFIRS